MPSPVIGLAPMHSAAMSSAASSMARAPRCWSGLRRRWWARRLGGTVGVAAAYFGGTTDLIIQRLADIMISFPIIILALAIVAILGSGTVNLIVAIALSFVPRIELVVRASGLSVRETAYVEAARAIGARHWRIILRHMVPNVTAPYLVMLTAFLDRKSTRLNSSHSQISYAVFCLKKTDHQSALRREHLLVAPPNE